MINELFQPHHDESLLKPCADLVAKLRLECIQVFAVPAFDPAQMAFLRVRQDSCVALQTTVGDYAIVLNSRAIQWAVDATGLSYGQALEGIALHERGHIFLLQYRGDASSESQSWDYAEARSSLSKAEMNRLRSYCQHGIQPMDKPEPKVDPRSPWLQRFDELASHLGYADAWQGTQCYRVTLSTDALFAELRRAGWSFDTSWTIAHENNISDGLRQLAIDRLDKAELLRNAIPPEQLAPDGSLPRGASLRF